MPTRYRGAESEVRALNAFIKLVRASETVTARLSRFLHAETGLTITQFGVLEALYHCGPMVQKEIAEKQLKSGGNITLVTDNLEKRGLVERRREERDRRLVTVHLTLRGRKMIAGYFPRHAAAIAGRLAVLTPREQEQLGRLCRKLGLASAP